MIRTIGALGLAAIVLLSQVIPAQAASTPSPGPTCPPPSASTPASSGGDAQSQLCNQQAELSQARADLVASIASARTADTALRSALQENARQQSDVTSRLSASRDHIAALDREIDELDGQISSVQARIGVERAQLASIERSLYRMPPSLLLVVLEAPSLRVAIVEIAEMTSAADRAERLRTGLQRDETELSLKAMKDRDDREAARAETANLQTQLERLVQLRADEMATDARLSGQIAASQDELAKLDSQSSQVALQLAQLLQAEQEASIAAAMQQVWNQTLTWLKTNPIGAVGVSAGHSQQYRFIWPEPNAVLTQHFGPSDLASEPPYSGYPHFHTGIDLAEPALSPVLAADDGVVAAVGSDHSGYGNYVILGHADGLLTLYAHLEQSVVTVGAQVTQGQPIGLEGSTGNSTGPHLHFEVRLGGTPVDPLTYLPPGPSATIR